MSFINALNLATQPRDDDGNPLWFSQEHFAWLERTFGWAPHYAREHIWEYGGDLTSRAYDLVRAWGGDNEAFRKVERRCEEAGLRMAWFVPAHNRWLEDIFGWEEGSVEAGYRADPTLRSYADHFFSNIVTGGETIPDFDPDSPQRIAGEFVPGYTREDPLAENPVTQRILRDPSLLDALADNDYLRQKMALMQEEGNLQEQLLARRDELDRLEALGSPGRLWRNIMARGQFSSSPHRAPTRPPPTPRAADQFGTSLSWEHDSDRRRRLQELTQEPLGSTGLTQAGFTPLARVSARNAQYAIRLPMTPHAQTESSRSPQMPATPTRPRCGLRVDLSLPRGQRIMATAPRPPARSNAIRRIARPLARSPPPAYSLPRRSALRHSSPRRSPPRRSPPRRSPPPRPSPPRPSPPRPSPPRPSTPRTSPPSNPFTSSSTAQTMRSARAIGMGVPAQAVDASMIRRRSPPSDPFTSPSSTQTTRSARGPGIPARARDADIIGRRSQPTTPTRGPSTRTSTGRIRRSTSISPTEGPEGRDRDRARARRSPPSDPLTSSSTTQTARSARGRELSTRTMERYMIRRRSQPTSPPRGPATRGFTGRIQRPTSTSPTEGPATRTRARARTRRRRS